MAMDDARSDSALIESALDAAHVIDDFVCGVAGLSRGDIGGDDDVRRRWSDRVLGKWLYNQRHVVHGMAGAYAHDQLHKAAKASADLVEAVNRLAEAGSEHLRGTSDELGAIGVEQLPAWLDRADPSPKSADVQRIHQQLSRIIGTLNAARSRAVLAEMRRRSGGQLGD
jgi:hypothetical protein